MNLARRLVVFALAIAVLWLSAGAILCEMTLRVPKRALAGREQESMNLAGWRQAQIVASDGAILRGTFHSNSGSKRCVALLHGITDSHTSALELASIFLDEGYAVLAPDSRGHGVSGGELITFGVLESDDVVRWAAFLRGQGCQKLFGLGESLGGAILIQAAARGAGFSAIIAESPFTDLPSIAEYRIAQAIGGPEALTTVLAKTSVSAAIAYTKIRYGLDLNDASPIESARKLTTPLLLIHGLEDFATLPSHSRAIAAANPTARVWFVQGAWHTGAFDARPAEFRKRALEWFDRAETTGDWTAR